MEVMNVGEMGSTSINGGHRRANGLLAAVGRMAVKRPVD